MTVGPGHSPPPRPQPLWRLKMQSTMQRRPRRPEQHFAPGRGLNSSVTTLRRPAWVRWRTRMTRPTGSSRSLGDGWQASVAYRSANGPERCELQYSGECLR